MKKQYLDYAGLKRVLKRLLPGARKIWHGTLAEWEALSETERNKYDQAEIIDGSGYQAKAWHPRPDWANAVTISADQLYAGYTAPSDGMFVCSGVMPTNNVIKRIITVNGITITLGQDNLNGEFSYGSTSCPVNEGDLIKSSNNDAWDYETRYFIPWKA